MVLLRTKQGVDEVVLLNNRSPKYVEREGRVKTILEGAHISRVFTESIDIFDFQTSARSSSESRDAADQNILDAKSISTSSPEQMS